MTLAEIAYIRAKFTGTGADSFEGRLNTICLENTLNIPVNQYDVVWDDGNLMLELKSRRKDAKGVVYNPIVIYMPYDRILSLHLDNVAGLRDNSLHGDINHWG
jgi:hypothetical protein